MDTVRIAIARGARLRGRSRPLLIAFITSLLSATAGDATAQSATGVVLNEVASRIVRTDLEALLDEDGTPQSFVELFNAGTSVQLVLGWSVRADGGVGGSWTLPALAIAPGEAIGIWTSSKDRGVPGAPLHADFALRSARFVSLHDAAGGLVDEVPLAIPVDQSYGRCGDSWYYFSNPTPGALNRASSIVPLVVLNEPVSLTVDRPHQLVALPVEDEVWNPLDPRLTTSADGTIRLLEDVLAPLPTSLAVEVRSPTLNATRRTKFTPVPWTANLSSLDPSDEAPVADQILGADDAGVYFSKGSILRRSVDGMLTSQPIGPLPTVLAGDSQLRSTPFGYVLRSGHTIHHSSDLTTWTLSFTATKSGLRSGFDAYWDQTGGEGRVLVAEYSTDPTQRHAVYRGDFSPNGESEWQTLVEFGSIQEGELDPTRLDVVRHVHAAVIDPYTGDTWVGTGDQDLHSRILTAPQNSSNLQPIGLGSQDWRALAIWFSPTHVYWNMDTTAAQSIWRVPRSMRDPIAGWPSITPELSSGTTKIGVRYLVTADTPTPRFPIAVGRTWTESSPRPLDAQHRVRPLNDPAFDYRERVATLDNGSHWFQLWVEDDHGERISLVATSAEGKRRDERGRVFGLKERTDGTVDVQELLTVESLPEGNPYVQLEPIAQDPLGNVYFEGRMTAQRLYKAALSWRDDDGSPTGGPTAAALAVLPPVPPQCLVPVPEPAIEAWSWVGISLTLILAGFRCRRACGEFSVE